MKKKIIYIVKNLTPLTVLKMLLRYRSYNQSKSFSGLSPKETFSKIYRDRLWGNYSSDKDGYDSGTGSHTESVVSPYIQSVNKFLAGFSEKPDLVDLGCGDFSIGLKTREYCKNYIACDVVEELLSRNRKKYASHNVDFRLLDITCDDIPHGDVLVIRQVLQHLTNTQIFAFTSKLKGSFRFLILTEHLPNDENFTPNLDKNNGPDTRLYNDSGVVLSEKPFSLSYKSKEIICEVKATAGIGGRIQTILYSL